MHKPAPHIAIIGAGWAGLAAAIELARHNVKLSLYESSPQAGGRARSIEWQGSTIDNGQHLMIGAYRELLSLLDTIGADSQSIFQRIPHHLLMRDANTGKTALELKLPRLPAPLHLLFGVLRIKQLPLKHKLQLLWRFDRLLKTPLRQDLSVTQWLQTAGLPEAYIQYVLHPICLAALTTYPEQASARAFQSVLQQTFNGPAANTDLLIANCDLGQVFPALAVAYLKSQGVAIYTRSKVQGLRLNQDKVSALQLRQQTQALDQVILATPPRVTAKLLENHVHTQAISQQIQQLKYEPVTTLYLRFTGPVKLPVPMMGMLNGLCEWVFERCHSGDDNMLAVVFSAHGEYLNYSQAKLVETVMGELKANLPQLPKLHSSKLIIDKYATLQCHPDVDTHRPGINTALRNLKLCGDYVYIEENNRAGLPSTLEGALRSGVKCAQAVVRDLNL